jgi:hypothetical protein
MSEDELWKLRIALIAGSGFETVFAHAHRDSTASFKRKKFTRPTAQKKEVARYIIPYIAPYQNPAWDPSGSFQNLPVYTPPPPMSSDGIPMLGNVQYDSSGKPIEGTTRRHPDDLTLQDEGYQHPYAWDLGGGYTDETLPSQQTWYPY